MVFIHQIAFRILNIKSNHWVQNIGHRPTSVRPIFVILVDYPKYDIHPSTSLTDIRQNHWTMKYR